MVGVGCLAYRKAPGKQVILERRMDLVCCFIVSFMFLKILSCNLHGGWTLPVEIPSFWGTGSCLFHNLWKSWYLMKAATPPPPTPNPRHTMGMLPAERGGEKYVSFWALLQERVYHLCLVAREVKSRAVMKLYWNFEAIWVVFAWPWTNCFVSQCFFS